MTVPATDLTISKSILVECPPERAFQVFTGGIDGWWPLETHSVGKERVQRAVFEEHVGGRIFEVWDDGSEHEWGHVTLWDPPHRVVYSWRPNLERVAFTEVSVRFQAEGQATRVELDHRGWERFGADAAEARASYDGGWETVLGRYVNGLV
jgi:uncharacterized protein YndB with AHSA1/START domain